MSKTEIVRSLNDSGPQLQIVSGLRDLSTDMKSLPQALASEVAPMLAELERLASMLDTNMEAQRSTFSAIASASAEQWKAQLQEAQELNRELRERLTALEAREELSVKAARAMINVPARIEKTVEDHARTMTEAVEEWRKLEAERKPWKTVLASAVLAAILATALHPLGTLVSSAIRPSEEALVKEGRVFRDLWQKATEEERRLLTKISER